MSVELPLCVVVTLFENAVLCFLELGSFVLFIIIIIVISYTSLLSIEFLRENRAYNFELFCFGGPLQD